MLSPCADFPACLCTQNMGNLSEKSFSQTPRCPDADRVDGGRKSFSLRRENAGDELATGRKPMSLPRFRKYRIALAALLAVDCASGDGRRPADVGAQRRQRRHGRCAGGALEREEPRSQDQPDLHSAYRNGAQDRAGDRQRRGARPDGHGPDLRPAVRGGRPAGRHHRQGQGLARAEDGEPRPHGGLDL